MKLAIRLQQALGSGDNSIIKLWTYQIATYSTLVSIAGSVLLIVWKWQSLPPAVPLWYSRPWGEERLAHPLWLFLLPLTSFVVYLLNMWTGVRVLSQHITFAKVLHITSTLTSCMTLIIVAKVLSLVS